MTPPEGLRRDAVTRAGYTVLATWAWFLYGFGAILPLLRAEQGTSRTVMGLHSLALATGGLIAGLTTLALVRRVRRRGAFTVGATLASLGILGLTLAPSPGWSMAAAVVAGTGGSTLLNTAMPALSDHHGSAGAAALSEGNAVAAGVGLLAPLAVGGAVGLGGSWRPAALVMLPLLAVVLFTVRLVPRGTPAVDVPPPPRHHDDRRLPPLFWAYLVMVVTCVGVEFCCVAWSADLLQQRAGMSPGAASIGVTAVVAGMTVGRASVGRLALVHPPRRLTALALGVAVAGWAVVWTSTLPAAGLTGLALTGLGIAGLFPLGAALLLGSVPGQGDQASSRMSVGIAIAAGGGPFALGAVADATSTHTAFLAVPLMIAVAAAALLLATRLVPAEPRRTPADPR